jgi:transcriptional regulator with AAA-type ATPase domain/streptogramin lyase
VEAGASHGESPPSRFVNFTSADGLPHDAIRSAFEDRNGNLWFCTGGGLTRYEGKQFHNFTLQEALLGGAAMSVGQNRDGQLFFGSWTGTSYYDGRHFATTDSLAATDHIWTFLEDSRGRLWFGGRRWDPVSYLEDGEFSTFAAPDGLMLWGVPAIAEDSQGRMWFGGTEEGEGNEGLRRYDGNELRTFTTADGLAHNEVTALLVDRAGILWIGTGGGLSRYDGEHFVSFTVTDGLAHNAIGALLEDGAGNLWVGTNGGVSRYDGTSWTSFTRADGLAGHRVWSILEDSQSVLWFGLWDGGVSRYDGLVFQTLSMQDGLVHDAVQGMLEDRHGDVWIATEGITRYRPMVGTPAIEVAGVLTDRSHGQIEEVRLPSTQDYLAFEVRGSSLNTAPERLVYAYRMQGFDQAWRWSKEADIVYQDLPTGDYLFEVKAVDRDLNYSENPATVRVVVHLPYAQIGLAAGLFLSVMGMAIAARSAAHHRRERDQARQDLVRERRQRIEVQPHEIEFWTLDDFVDQSPAMQLLFDEIRRLQQAADNRVLISGEAGTGKELIARALHAGSARGDGVFVPVRCAALPADVAQSLTQRTEALSQLFGHEPGAFAGVDTQRDGFVQQAAGGTLFFDEVGVLPLPLQSQLLRVLTQREVRRLGAEAAEPIDVRVLAATTMDLPAQVESGAFRAELYEFLAPHTMVVPPLRERVEDIPLLADYFAQALLQKMGWTRTALDAGIAELLRDYSYPGNVRELKNIIERALIESGGRPIETKHLHFLRPS